MAMQRWAAAWAGMGRDALMFRRNQEKEPERWYLLPAMQHGARKKFMQRITAAVVVGVLTAAVLGAAIYYANRI
jgi:hypothetical protein